jgi:hypothetical protein
VAASLHAVLPAAGACLGPDAPVSRAVVVFAPTGEVESVTLSGPAPSPAAEGCIREALSSAVLPEFGEGPFRVTVNVRGR